MGAKLILLSSRTQSRTIYIALVLIVLTIHFQSDCKNECNRLFRLFSFCAIDCSVLI